MSKTLNKWKTLIDTKLKYENAPFSENEVIFIRKTIGPAGMKNFMHRRSLYSYFIEQMPQDGYNITIEHQQKGIDYLRKNTYKKNGALRKNNIFGDFERHIIDTFSHFKFVGMYELSSGHMLPLYKCVSHSGASFTYTGNVYSCITIVDHDHGTLQVA